MNWKERALKGLLDLEFKTGRCPICGGWQQAAIPDTGIWADMVGHREGCELERLIKEGQA